MTYIGRFAPSPSGPLHFGSLVAAVGSFLAARAAGGQWLLRIEDIDPPREVKGASALILSQLEQFGLLWDGTVLYQSQRQQAYDEVLADLRARDLLYACTCSRRELAGQNPYQGRCATRRQDLDGACAWRVRGAHHALEFVDGVHGPCRFVAAENDDFIVRRRDGLYAYALAVVVDDIAQGITDIVRGSDLLSSTPRQLHLWQTLSTRAPTFTHLPLVLDAHGQKLSKQNWAPALHAGDFSTQMAQALTVLGQELPADLATAPVAEQLAYATAHWQLANVPIAMVGAVNAADASRIAALCHP